MSTCLRNHTGIKSILCPQTGTFAAGASSQHSSIPYPPLQISLFDICLGACTGVIVIPGPIALFQGLTWLPTMKIWQPITDLAQARMKWNTFLQNNWVQAAPAG